MITNQHHIRQTFGILLLSLSLWVRSDSGLWVYTENLTLSRYYWACYMGMGAGSLLVLVSFMGCMSALLESRLLVTAVSLFLRKYQDNFSMKHN